MLAAYSQLFQKHHYKKLEMKNKSTERFSDNKHTMARGDKTAEASSHAALDKVKTFIRQKGIMKEGCKAVVGLSGGPDSVCLALMFHRLGYEVVGMHCNFHLRGEESMRDERFAETLCRQLGIEYRKVDFDTLSYAKEKKVSVEMAARELRYDAFRQMKEETGADVIAVGHHQDDNMETMVLNMVRGTGIKGLCGMQPANDDIIRPLLCLRRCEILDFLAHCGQDYVTDHTNLEDEYARNKVRLNIVPTMERINKGAVANIVETMDNLNEVHNIYIWWIEQVRHDCCSTTPSGDLRIDIRRVLSLPSPISALHELLAPAGLNKAELTALLDVCHHAVIPSESASATSLCSETRTASGKVFGKKGRRVLVDRDCLLLETDRYEHPIIRQTILPIAEVEIKKDPYQAYLDADKLTGELTLRTPQPGDTFAPFGMGGRRKLLSDYMTDQKMNLFEKERQLLLMDGKEIAWVVGRRGSEKYRVDKKTRRVVVVTAK